MSLYVEKIYYSDNDEGLHSWPVIVTISVVLLKKVVWWQCRKRVPWSVLVTKQLEHSMLKDVTCDNQRKLLTFDTFHGFNRNWRGWKVTRNNINITGVKAYEMTEYVQLKKRRTCDSQFVVVTRLTCNIHHRHCKSSQLVKSLKWQWWITIWLFVL